MNLNLTTYERQVYSIFDWIGSIGGLNEGLYIFFTVLISVLNYKNYENFMVSHLFEGVVKEEKEEKKDDPAAYKRSVTIFDQEKVNTALMLLYSCKPDKKKWCCHQKSESYKHFTNGRRLYAEQIGIVNILQMLRFNRMLIRHKLNTDHKDSSAMFKLAKECKILRRINPPETFVPKVPSDEESQPLSVESISPTARPRVDWKAESPEKARLRSKPKKKGK